MVRRYTLDSLGDLGGIRGRLSVDADLSKVTWFRVGGPADILFQPADSEDLANFLKAFLPFEAVEQLTASFCSLAFLINR